MITEIDAADWLTLSSAWRLDEGLPANREIASAKLYASEMLARVTDEAIAIYGGMGLMNDLPIAVFGGGWAANVVEQLLKAGFDGDIWPVHPKRETVHGVKDYQSLADLPAAPDAAWIGVLCFGVQRDG